VTAVLTPTVADAYRVCEEVTRREARNFSYGIRLLPTDKRRALSAVYALSRRIDDIGDEPGEPGTKLAELEQVRAQVGALDEQTDPVLAALADAAGRFPLPLQAFSELVDGVQSDVRGQSYETFDELVGYCRQVAGTVGRLCLGVYGATDLPRASRLADDLGVALQQTNVLRDVREDLATGRIYLPAAELRAAGGQVAACSVRPPRPSRPTSAPRRSGPAAGMPPACRCWRCWTAAAQRAPPRWPASTSGSTTGSSPTPPPSPPAGSRCRAAPRPGSQPAPC
jgi:phytoene/squalene synthetase